MLKPEPIPDIPPDTQRIAHAAFPKGTTITKLRDAFYTVYEDADFAALFPTRGQPALAPWRLALITVFQFLENLTDRQAADAVRSRIDWKYTLCLELSDAGFDFSVLSEFRARLLASNMEQVLLDKLLERFTQLGLLKARGKQRTDSTHVLSSVRHLNRLELVTETMRATLNALVDTAPDWLQSWMPVDWVERYARRSEESRLPNSKAGRDRHALIVGDNGSALLDAARDSRAPEEVQLHPMVTTLEQVWEQQYERIDGRAKWRSASNFPPAGQRIESPYDTDARFNSKRGQGWSGYKVHLSETCDDDAPRFVTHVETTQSTVTDVDMTQVIHHCLQDKKLLPTDHIVDTGYISSALLVNTIQAFDLRLVGPPALDYSWQARAGKGFDSSAFQIDWDKRRVTCPMGKTSVIWHETTKKGDAFCTAKFAFADCFSCRERVHCTRTVRGPRQLTFLPRDQRESLQVARDQHGNVAWQAAYARRAGIEGTISEAVRSHGLRRSRYRGLSKTGLQMIAVRAAVNVSRVVNWLDGLRPVSSRTLPLTRLGLIA